MQRLRVHGPLIDDFGYHVRIYGVVRPLPKPFLRYQDIDGLSV